MKVELHLHTSRYSDCAVATPSELMETAVAAGYDAVYITEHHRIWQDHELDWLRERFPDVLIFPGVEINLPGEAMQHLLVLGTNDPTYLTLAESADILRRARDEGHLTVLAHPCRWPGAGQILDDGLRPDAMEYRTCNQDLHAAGAALAWAGELGLPVVNAGDVHSVEMVGRYWIETARPLTGPDDVRPIILAGQYERFPRDDSAG